MEKRKQCFFSSSFWTVSLHACISFAIVCILGPLGSLNIKLSHDNYGLYTPAFILQLRPTVAMLSMESSPPLLNGG